MSLDIAILNNEGAPEKYVSIGANLHHELISLSTEIDLDVISILHDYYRDAEIPAEAVSIAIDQINTLQNRGVSEDLFAFLGEFRELAMIAMDTGRGLYSIAD